MTRLSAIYVNGDRASLRLLFAKIAGFECNPDFWPVEHYERTLVACRTRIIPSGLSAIAKVGRSVDVAISRRITASGAAAI